MTVGTVYQWSCDLCHKTGRGTLADFDALTWVAIEVNMPCIPFPVRQAVCTECQEKIASKIRERQAPRLTLESLGFRECTPEENAQAIQSINEAFETFEKPTKTE